MASDLLRIPELSAGNILTHLQILVLMITFDISFQFLKLVILLLALLALLFQSCELVLGRQQLFVVF